MQEPLAIRPMQWAALPALSDAAALDAEDMACLVALRAVLARHGKLDRFAVHLAHKHFELAPDEILIEQPDPDGRTQHVTVGRRGDFPAALPTTWLFDDAPLSPHGLHLADALYCVCVTDVHAGTCGGHGQSSTPPAPLQEEEAARQERIQREEATARNRPIAGHDRDRERERD